MTEAVSSTEQTGGDVGAQSRAGESSVDVSALQAELARERSLRQAKQADLDKAQAKISRMSEQQQKAAESAASDAVSRADQRAAKFESEANKQAEALAAAKAEAAQARAEVLRERRVGMLCDATGISRGRVERFVYPEVESRLTGDLEAQARQAGHKEPTPQEVAAAWVAKDEDGKSGLAKPVLDALEDLRNDEEIGVLFPEPGASAFLPGAARGASEESMAEVARWDALTADAKTDVDFQRNAETFKNWVMDPLRNPQAYQD